MTITIVQALLLGFYVMIVSAMVPGPALWHNALTTSLWVGLIMGDIPGAIMIGATLALIYLGATGAAGGVVVQDEVAATLVTVPLVLATGLDITAGIAIAIPVGLVCAQLNNLQELVMSIPAHMVDRFIEKGNDKGIVFCNIAMPYILRIFVRWLPLSALIFVGGTVAEGIADAIPEVLTNALSAVGGVMPSVGLGIVMYTMGNAIFIPFLIAGFFLVEYTGVSTIGAGLVGAFLAFLYYIFVTKPKRDANPVPAAETVEVQHILTKKDVNKSFWTWIIFGINCESWERKLGIGFGSALQPSLKKLYPDPEDYKAALNREMEFFNTEKCFGACVPGVALAMEEQKALGEPITEDAIRSVKTGLMGPFAGIGDSIMWGPVYILCVAMCVPACASTGSWIAALMPVIVFAAVGIVIAWFMFRLGYNSGAKSATTLLQNGTFADILPLLTILGMFMIGALGASYVTVTTPLEFSSATGLSFALQDTLDSIAPGILSLCTLFISYFVTKKFKNFLWTCLIMLAIGLVLGLLGIIV